MNSFTVAVNAIIPITAVMILGFAARKKGIVSETSLNDFNKVVFRYCLPLSLFESIIQIDSSSIANPLLIGYCMVFLCLIICMGVLILHCSSISKAKKGVFVQALFRSNFVILGLPIVESIYGRENVGITSVMVALLVPFLNVAAVLILQIYSGKKINLKSTLEALIKNPMIIGAVLGLIGVSCGFCMPSLGSAVLASITKMTTPLALFVLGGTFQFHTLAENRFLLTGLTFLRLILIPALGLAGAVLLSFRGVELISMLVLFGGPVAVASYPMAQQMGLDGEFAAQAVLVTTLLVLGTLFMFITGLGTFNLI